MKRASFCPNCRCNLAQARATNTELERHLAKIRAEVRRLPKDQQPTRTGLTIHAAAKRLGLAKEQLLSMRMTGQLMFFKVGRSQYVAVSDIEQLEARSC